MPTTKILPLGVFCYGRAIVRIPWAIYSANKNGHKLSDLETSIPIITNSNWLEEDERKNLENNMRLYQILLLYKPSIEKTWLIDYKNHGPTVSDSNTEEILPYVLKLA